MNQSLFLIGVNVLCVCFEGFRLHSGFDSHSPDVAKVRKMIQKKVQCGF